ncbi:glutamate--tRNA ligase [Leadbetterella sp. DM7]|uniref:glutamate--tRNA ligase n=1 Tax=Leadbetterella sp. DM7 TaxID=3235085 RepID=UPI00349E7327
MSVRVRFAPSPTGPLHIGGVRTALYNYLFARKMGGKMLLRIEDTDQTRLVPGAQDYILEALQWIGISIDEGVGSGGELGPYVQSERKDIYARYAQELLDKGQAYYAFDTPEELDQMRKELEEAKVDNISYNAFTRMKMKNSITLPAGEVKAKLEAGEPYVIRLKVPLKDEIRFKDLVRGWVSVHSSTIDDKILMKSDGMPTYHLANIVDDHLMEITHVIRGEEWLPSAPLHILLYKAFGWQAPEFAHLPLLLKPEGNGKLSKRDGVLGDFPVFPLEWKDPVSGDISRGFREDGYYPEAVMNFLALLGWNPGNDQELMSREELIELFDIHNIQKAGARFDVNKAKWFNQQYLRKKENDVLAAELDKEIGNPALSARIVELMKDRVDFVREMKAGVPFVFEAPAEYDKEVAAKKWDDLARNAMPVITAALAEVTDFASQHIHDAIFGQLEAAGIKPGKVMQALRLAVTGEGKGPDLMLIMEILGKEETVRRIGRATEVLG